MIVKFLVKHDNDDTYISKIMTNEATLTKIHNSKHINKDSPTKKTDSSLLLTIFMRNNKQGIYYL